MTPIPGVFFIASKWNSQYVITAMGDSDYGPVTIEKMKDGYQPEQLWQFLPTGGCSGYNMIQHYTENGYCLDVDAGGGIGKDIHMWSTNGNDNQKMMVTVNE